MLRNDTRCSRHSERADDPTPAQIRQRCRKIRKEWSESTRRRRAVQVATRWTIPMAKQPSVDSIGAVHHN